MDESAHCDTERTARRCERDIRLPPRCWTGGVRLRSWTDGAPRRASTGAAERLRGAILGEAMPRASSGAFYRASTATQSTPSTATADPTTDSMKTLTTGSTESSTWTEPAWRGDNQDAAQVNRPRGDRGTRNGRQGERRSLYDSGVEQHGRRCPPRLLPSVSGTAPGVSESRRSMDFRP